jgi:hypothetical protein
LLLLLLLGLLLVWVVGVRNYVARNYMREMQVGDQAFFYHSSCKVPGIVGIVKVRGGVGGWTSGKEGSVGEAACGCSLVGPGKGEEQGGGGRGR